MPPLAICPLLKLVGIVFLHAIRRVGDDRVERVLGNSTQPREAIGMKDTRTPDSLRWITQMLAIRLYPSLTFSSKSLPTLPYGRGGSR